MGSILIASTGRSGSTFVNNILNHLNIKSQHEIRVNKHDINDIDKNLSFCGWKFIWFDSLDRFDNILHQVRNPLDTIASAMTHDNILFDQLFSFMLSKNDPYFNKCYCKLLELPHTLYKMIYRSMIYWYFLNIHIESITSNIYKVETLNDINGFKQFCKMINYNDIVTDEQFSEISKLFKRERIHIDVTFDLLNKLDPHLTSLIKTKALDYGYK